jgi:hypothetical protein
MSGFFLKKISFLLLFLFPTSLFAAADIAPTKKLETLWNGELMAGNPVTGTIIIRDIASGEAITDEGLKANNKQKIHLLLIDSTFKDVQHVHPQPSTTPYAFNFTFTPKISGSYKAWVNITPYNTDKQELLSGWIGEKDSAFVERVESYKTVMNGYNFTLSSDVPLAVGQTSVVNINVTDSANNPVKWSIESISKMYSADENFNIIGIYEDNEHALTAIQEINNNYIEYPFDGPDAKFKITPTQAGFVRIFAQMTIAGKEMFVPFGVVVQK